MRLLWLSVAGAIAFAASAAANASIIIGTNVPGADPYAGPTPTFTFDTIAGTPSFTGGAVVSGTSASHAQPLGSTGSYYSVGLDDGTTGVIDLSSYGDVFNISLLWGSIDSYNTLEFLDSANNVLATFGGDAIRDPANGNQTDPDTNRVVTFLLSDSDVSAFSKLRLTSNSNAFEIDNIAVNVVPEPGSWILMIVGFCGLGLALRRRRRGMLAQLA